MAESGVVKNEAGAGGWGHRSISKLDRSGTKTRKMSTGRAGEMAQDTTEEEPAHPGCQSTGAGWEMSWREGPSLVPVGGREEEGSGKPLRRRGICGAEE